MQYFVHLAPTESAAAFLYCSNIKIVELTGLVFSWQTAGIIIRNYEVRIHTGVGGLYNQKWKRMGYLMAASGRKFMFFMSLFCDIAMNRLEQTLSQHDHQTGRVFFISFDAPQPFWHVHRSWFLQLSQNDKSRKPHLQSQCDNVVLKNIFRSSNFISKSIIDIWYGGILVLNYQKMVWCGVQNLPTGNNFAKGMCLQCTTAVFLQ